MSAAPGAEPSRAMRALRRAGLILLGVLAGLVLAEAALRLLLDEHPLERDLERMAMSLGRYLHTRPLSGTTTTRPPPSVPTHKLPAASRLIHRQRLVGRPSVLTNVRRSVGASAMSRHTTPP